MLGNFMYCNPTRIYFGNESLDKLEGELSKYGEKVLFVYGGGSIKKIGLYLLCALCLMCFACCAQPDSTGGSSSQNTASDSMQGDSTSQDLSASYSSDDSQEDNSSQDSSSSYLSDDSQEDENELPRVPYGAE